MASEVVLSKMAVKTVYSQNGEVAKDHSRYWSGFLGMYLRTGLALRAYCIQLRCKKDRHHLLSGPSSQNRRCAHKMLILEYTSVT